MLRPMSLTTIKRRVQERLDVTGIDMKRASIEAGNCDIN